MKKYKELSAFETNEFKVGDKVRVYKYEDYFPSGADFWIDTAVLNVFEQTIQILDDNCYHFKACRKLEEINPREFFLFEDSHGRLNVFNELTDYGKEVYPNVIKVREVLEDENEQ